MVCVWSLFPLQGWWWWGQLQRNPVHRYALQSAEVFLARTQTSALFISSEARRGYREVGLSGGSFIETWVMNLNPFDLTHSSLFCCCGSRVSYRKALVSLGCLLLMANIQSLICGVSMTFWLDGLAYSNIWCRFYYFFLLNSPDTHGMATFGWCSTEKPAMFTRPSHVRTAELRACTHALLQSHPVGYSKLRVPFLFPLQSPFLFFLLLTCIDPPEEPMAHTVTLHVQTGQLGSAL